MSPLSTENKDKELMAGYSVQELQEITAHLEKVGEIHANNVDSDEIELELPDIIYLNRTSNGLPLGTIEWESEYEEYVFIPYEEKTALVRSTAHIPIPPPLHTFNP